MRERALERLAGRELAFGFSRAQDAGDDLAAYRRLVALAVDGGATHVAIGPLPFRYGNWVLPDPSDPYASWTNGSPSLLRVCPPPELERWIPAADAEAAQAWLRAQIEVLRPHGLRAAMSGVEPMWLPEGVYRAHPRWRGAQCELGRIARRPYFAPSVDEPEVLDLYRRAMRRFCELFPEVDEMSFLSNDSGAGVAWTPCVYPGMNGPPRWRTRDGGARLAGFLNALRDGAAEAGASVRVNLQSSGFPPELTASARQQVEPGLFVRGGNRHGEVWGGPGAGLPGGLWTHPYPATGLADPIGFVEGLQRVYHNASGDRLRCEIRLHDLDLEWGRLLLETFLSDPGTGRVHRDRVLLAAAGRLGLDAAGAEELVGVWETVRRAEHAVAQVRQKGFSNLLPFAMVSMRWLLRPLVPEAERLTPAETAPYAKFVFSIGAYPEHAHFGYVLGKAVFRGESVMWMARWCLQEAADGLRGARRSVLALAERAADPAGADRLRLYAARVGAFACLCLTARNAIMYQYALDIRRQPQYGPNPMDYDDNILYDQRGVTLRKIAREELDNTAELIELVEGQTEKVLEHADCPEAESVFLLGPDPVRDLRRKMDVMLDHWPDYERLYPSTKAHDFEPEPEGNIVPPERTEG